MPLIASGILILTGIWIQIQRGKVHLFCVCACVFARAHASFQDAGTDVSTLKSSPYSRASYFHYVIIAPILIHGEWLSSQETQQE